MKYRGTSLLVQRMVFSVLQNFLCAVQMPKVQKKECHKKSNKARRNSTELLNFYKRERETLFSLNIFSII